MRRRALSWRESARPVALLLAAASFAVGSFLAFDLVPGREAGGPRQHTIDVVARRYAFDPPVIRVDEGDEVRLRFASLDVVHGMHLEGYDLDVTIEPLRREVELRRAGGPAETVREVVFAASQAGRFRYRCSKTCGAMHPFMGGELVVGPNWLARASGGVAFGLLAGGFAWIWLRAGRGEGE